MKWLAKPTCLLVGGQIDRGHRLPGTLLISPQEHLEARVEREHGRTSVDCPAFLPSLVDLLHGGSLC